MLTVACVLRSGGVYSPEWVVRLRNGVARNLPPHRFVCLSDTPIDGVETIPLVADLPRWWSKIELFRPGIFSDRVLYLDLDCVVVGRLEPLCLPVEPGELVACADFITSGINSSAMLFRGDLSHLWEAFMSDPVTAAHVWDKVRPKGRIGDQGFIEEELGRPARRFPAGYVVSFKKHARNGLPPGARVVAFHGRPKPDQLTPIPDWVSLNWR